MTLNNIGKLCRIIAVALSVVFLVLVFGSYFPILNFVMYPVLSFIGFGIYLVLLCLPLLVLFFVLMGHFLDKKTDTGSIKWKNINLVWFSLAILSITVYLFTTMLNSRDY